MSVYTIIISSDPGIYGGICILQKNKIPIVYKMPIKETIINKKKKKVYDLIEISKIFRSYTNKKVKYIQESVHSQRGEGSSSSFGFGKSAGSTIGMAYALEFEVIEVSPQKWKKDFPELITDSIKEKKEEIKKLRSISKILEKKIEELKLNSKTIKEKEEKKKNNKERNIINNRIKDNKKQIDKINRQIKKDAKEAARKLVSKKYPQLKDLFLKKNTDGMAESVLIALYGKKHELV